jgi:hypothetical protein
MNDPAQPKIVTRPIRRQIGHLIVDGVPRIGPPSFKDLRRLYSQFRAKRKSEGTRLSELLGEAGHRLEQLDFIIKRVWFLEREPANRQSNRADDAVEIMVLCEAFYYFASRFQDILQRFDGLRKFKVGAAADVRHHLIEHPEKHGKAINFNYAFGFGWCGPVIKPFGARHPGRNSKTTYDRGLYVNADELIERTVVALRQVLEKPAKGGVE